MANASCKLHAKATVRNATVHRRAKWPCLEERLLEPDGQPFDPVDEVRAQSDWRAVELDVGEAAEELLGHHFYLFLCKTNALTKMFVVAARHVVRWIAAGVGSL